MSASGSNVHKLLRAANFCTWVIKNEQILGTVIFQRNDKLKVYTLNKLKIINFFLHDIMELIEKINIVKLGLNCSNFQPLMYQIRFARIAGSKQRYKNAVFQRNNLVQKFGEGKMYPAALHKIPLQTMVSSKVLARCICQKQTQRIESFTKKGTKTIEDLEQVCPKHDHDLLSTFWSSKTILSKLIFSVWSSI